MWITLDKESSTSLARQLYSSIKQLILDGTLCAGDKLPSTRALATELSVSRNTILEAYSQLIAEGYLCGHPGSGTLVSEGIARYTLPLITSNNQLSLTRTSKTNKIDFRSGIPDLSLFPNKEWGKLYQLTCANLPPAAFYYHSPAGVQSLRQTIATYLLRTRGLTCNPNNIMIVSGSTQGLSLISDLLYAPGKEVMMEDPTHPGLRRVISNSGYSITGVGVDHDGLNTALLQPRTNVSFVYSTPSHQYPLGGILPIRRRLALIQYALSNNCYLIEDDYDSEFRFEGQPVNSLFELNPQKVIYLGTFSKILAPALRLGYVILPDELVAPFLERKQHLDVHTEAISQYVLADFIENGSLEKHIWTMKKRYAKKRQHLIQELSLHFPNSFELKGQAAGLHLVVHFNHVTFTEELLTRIASTNIKIYPIDTYEFQKTSTHSNELLLGYAHLTFVEITKGIKILSDYLQGN